VPLRTEVLDSDGVLLLVLSFDSRTTRIARTSIAVAIHRRRHIAAFACVRVYYRRRLFLPAQRSCVMYAVHCAFRGRASSALVVAAAVRKCQRHVHDVTRGDITGWRVRRSAPARLTRRAITRYKPWWTRPGASDCKRDCDGGC
jgi:hypothetical protein